MDLAELIARHTDGEGIHVSRIPRLDLVRISGATGPVHSMHEQAVVFVANGSKRVVIGKSIFTHAADQFLIVSVAATISADSTHASSIKPEAKIEPAASAGATRSRIAVSARAQGYARQTAALNRSTAGWARIVGPGVRFSKCSRRQVTAHERRQNWQHGSTSFRSGNARTYRTRSETELNSRLLTVPRPTDLDRSQTEPHDARYLSAASTPTREDALINAKQRAASRSLNSSSRRTDRSLNPAPGWVSRILVRTVLAQGNGRCQA